ncbi:hypothetical protein [Streptomyces atratus]
MVPWYAEFADRGTSGAPEDVVPGNRALAVIELVRMAMDGPAVAGP